MIEEDISCGDALAQINAAKPGLPKAGRVALHGALARNNTRLWTPRGLAWLESALLRMAPVNENVPILVMGALQNARNFPDGYRDAALGLLQRVQAVLPSVAPGAHALASRLRAALRTGP